MDSRNFIYAIHGRIFWVGQELCHLPVLNELYSVHLIEKPPKLAASDECINYVVRSSHRFIQEEVFFSAIQEQAEKEMVLLNFEKTKHYFRLCEFVNLSLQSSLPAAFLEESDKIDALIQTLLKPKNSEVSVAEKHGAFVGEVYMQKKEELKRRYKQIVHQLWTAQSLPEVRDVGNSLIFSEIHVL